MNLSTSRSTNSGTDYPSRTPGRSGWTGRTGTALRRRGSRVRSRSPRTIDLSTPPPDRLLVLAPPIPRPRHPHLGHRAGQRLNDPSNPSSPISLNIGADHRLTEPTVAAVLATVGSLAAWVTMAPSSTWIPLALLPAIGLLALIWPGRPDADAAKVVRAGLLLAAGAVQPILSSAMTPVTLLIALAVTATYGMTTSPRAARAVIVASALSLLTPLVADLVRTGPAIFVESLLHPASGTQLAVRIALTSGMFVVGLAGASAMATRRALSARLAALELTTGPAHGPVDLDALTNLDDNFDELDDVDELDDLQPAEPIEAHSELDAAEVFAAIEVSYQPVLALGSDPASGLDFDDRIVGAELVLDGDLLAMAEEAGLAPELGLHLISEGLDALLEWRAEGVGVDQVWVSLTPELLEDTSVVQSIAERLAVRQLTSSCLVVQVSAARLDTEAQSASSLATLSMLRSLGIAIVLSDFGCSGTSLTSLRTLPLSAVKLDPALAAELGRSDQVARSMAQLCHSLGLRVVADGITSMVQLRGAREISADAAQGRAIARPMSARDVTNLLSLRLPRDFRLR